MLMASDVVTMVISIMYEKLCWFFITQLYWTQSYNVKISRWCFVALYSFGIGPVPMKVFGNVWLNISMMTRVFIAVMIYYMLIVVYHLPRTWSVICMWSMSHKIQREQNVPCSLQLFHLKFCVIQVRESIELSYCYYSKFSDTPVLWSVVLYIWHLFLLLRFML